MAHGTTMPFQAAAPLQLTTAEAPIDQCECPYPEWRNGLRSVSVNEKALEAHPN